MADRLVAGSVLALAATDLIRSLLWGVQETDPLTFAVAIVASAVPALRVRRLDPVSLLRE